MNISTTLSNWQQVEQWLDSESGWHIPPSYLERASKPEYPRDAFSLGQLASKAWLLQHADATGMGRKELTVAILGCWIGTLVEPLLDCTPRIKRIYGFDVDPEAVELSERFNIRHVQNQWRYKGVVADVNTLDCALMQFQTNGELIEVKPDVIINTSCEHMSTDWFHSVADDQLIIMQTNNSPDFDGHINTCSSRKEMQQRYPLRDILFEGKLELPIYTRYMQIGFK